MMNKQDEEMPSIFIRTFGGLERQYYYRNLFFGLLFMGVWALLIIALSVTDKGPPVQMLIAMASWGVVTTFLYPYSRFLIDIVIGFFMGNVNVYQTLTSYTSNAYTKIAIGWAMAIIFAPIGLIFLLIINTKNIKHERINAEE